MGFYASDREFTDYVHTHLAEPLIYQNLNWRPQSLNQNLSTNADMSNAVDVFLIDKTRDRLITVQERFREYKYHTYNDFTIRYQREFSKYEERKQSEFFKLDADYFVYGIINDSKVHKERATGFVKYAIIDLKILKTLFDRERIVIDPCLKGVKCVAKYGRLFCPVNYNYDKSSSFIPIDIKLLMELFPDSNVVLKQHGFY